MTLTLPMALSPALDLRNTTGTALPALTRRYPGYETDCDYTPRQRPPGRPGSEPLRRCCMMDAWPMCR